MVAERLPCGEVSGWRFQPEEASFHVQPAAETTEVAVAGDDAVTGDNDRQWIFAQSLTHGAGCFWFVNMGSHPAVALGFGIGDESGRPPYLTLKGGGW